MKDAYVSPCSRAAVYTRYLGDGDWEVQNVVTDLEARGRGLQRELWERVLADADAEGVSLLLSVGTGRDRGMSSASTVT